METAWTGWRRWGIMALVVGAVIAMSWPLAATAAAENSETLPRCGAPDGDSETVEEMLSSLVSWLVPRSSDEPDADADCLAAETDSERSSDRDGSRLSLPSDDPTSEVPLNRNYTLSGLMEHNEASANPGSASDLQMQFGENISLLARHPDVTKDLVRTFVQVSDMPPSDATLGERVPQELSLQLGGTTLEAKADFMSGLTQYLARSLMNADVPLPESGDEVTLVFNMDRSVSGLDVSTVLQRTKEQHDLPSALNIGEVTVKISNGDVTSQAELEPAEDKVQLKQGKFAVDYDFGSNTLKSTTTFSRGEGVEEQRFQLTAQLGSVDFTGQASILNNTGQQQFKLEAFWEGLTFSTLLTPQGFQESSLGLDLEF